MSIPVPVEDLDVVIGRYGPRPFLLTTGDDARPHATHVAVTVDGNRLHCAIGRRTARNAGARPLVSLVWPPIEAEGFSLIVDGAIEVDSDVAEARATIIATNAVLHRPAPVAETEPGACGSDCLEIRIPES